MLWHLNLCTVLYYLLPNFLNSTLVLYFIYKKTCFIDINIKKAGMVKYSVLIFVLYFSIFSGIFSTIILAVFVSMTLLIEINDQKKSA
jgi:hypothetical protein